MNKQQWFEKLKKGEAFCYFKPNRHVHDSGYRCFEVGYLTLDSSSKKIMDKLVLSTYSDHVWINEINSSLNLDLLKDGYIRIFSREILWWGSLRWVVSSARLEILNKNEKIEF